MKIIIRDKEKILLSLEVDNKAESVIVDISAEKEPVYIPYITTPWEYVKPEVTCNNDGQILQFAHYSRVKRNNYFDWVNC